MAEPSTQMLNGQLKGTGKRVVRSTEPTPPEPGLGSTSGVPCGACKFLRRRCVDGCIFAPHFSPEQGTALFAAVHKVFGASNVSKLLMQLPLHLRHHAVETISYEAQARLSDPVCGCVSIIIALQQKVAALQMELEMVQSQVINTRLMESNTLQGSLQQLQQPHQPDQLNHFEPQQGYDLDFQPVYSNGPSASNNNNIINMNMFDSGLQNLANDNQNVAYPQPVFDPLQFTGPLNTNEGDVNGVNNDPFLFVEQMF